MENEASIDLKTELTSLIKNLEKLSAALRNLAKNDFANFCFRSNSSRYKGKLNLIENELIKLDVPESEARLDITSLNDISAFLDIASRKLRLNELQLLITSRIFTNSSETFDLPYNNTSVRSLFFTGNLIFSRSE
ncbi:MAG: hypothetical protein AAGA77_11425 [Bacteroidota bacterium]